jgi:hypothetical protein
MADRDWLPFNRAVAYVAMETGLDGDVAAGLLSDAVGAGQVRSYGRYGRLAVELDCRDHRIVVSGGRYHGGVTSADIAFDKNLQGEVLASDLRAWTKALKAGKTSTLNRVLTRSEREAVLEKLTELRANNATNAEQEAAIEELVGFMPRRAEIRELQKETGLRRIGRRRNSAEK